MANIPVEKIELLISLVNDTELGHIFSNCIFEIAIRGNTTPREVCETAFKLSPQDETFISVKEFL